MISFSVQWAHLKILIDKEKGLSTFGEWTVTMVRKLKKNPATERFVLVPYSLLPLSKLLPIICGVAQGAALLYCIPIIMYTHWNHFRKKPINSQLPVRTLAWLSNTVPLG